MPRPLIIALTLSLVLHGGLLSMNLLDFTAPPRPPALRASLRPPEPPKPEPVPVAETLLKNTIEDDARETPPPPPPVEKRGTPALSPDRRPMEAARKKLADYVFYPEQARRLGLEGTVTLYVELAANGRVENVSVVASSGFPILDNAAIRGFYAVGRLPGESGYWEYTFRLE